MASRAQAARLLAADKSAPGARLLMLGRGATTIGRGTGIELDLSDACLEHRHARITYARGRYFLEDLGSESGTFVNGLRLRRVRALKHGDQIRFGPSVSYRFIDPDAARRRRGRIRLNALAAAVVLAITGWFVHYQGWDAGVFSRAPADPTPPTIARMPEPASVSSSIAFAAAGSAPARHAAPIAAVTPAAAPSKKVTAGRAPSPASRATGSTTVATARINRYRTLAGLTPLADEPAISAAAAAHANYLLLNFNDAIRKADPLSDSAHVEIPKFAGYTPTGANIAPNSQLGWGCNTNDINGQIDNWIAGPFHRFDLLDPNVTLAGFGEATRDDCWAAALRIEPSDHPLNAFSHAVEFPPDGATVALDWIGVESPDPLVSCPDYSRPVGLPITLQLGRLSDIRLLKESLTENGHPIPHCAFDSRAYRNPIGSEQEWGRWALRNSGGVVMIPRAPLVVGAKYAVSITTQAMTYSWSFQVAKVNRVVQ